MSSPGEESSSSVDGSGTNRVIVHNFDHIVVEGLEEIHKIDVDDRDAETGHQRITEVGDGPETKAMSGDEKEPEDSADWSDLPSVSVEKIYSFLSRTDSYRMSQVCQRWSKEYSSPSVWKTFKYHLPEYEYHSEVYPEVKFARKYGCMFRYVEVICVRIRQHLIEKIRCQLILFLKALEEGAQITSVIFVNMANYFRYLDDDSDLDEVIKAMATFFESQKQLKVVEFRDTNLRPYKCIEILNSINVTEENTIRKLRLGAFINENRYDAEEDLVLPDFEPPILKDLLSCVQTLEMDYTMLFEQLLANYLKTLSDHPCIQNHKQPALTKIILDCDGSKQANFHAVPPTAWKTLTRFSPELKIEMDITCRTNLVNEIEKFVSRNIPLQKLEFRYDRYHGPRRTPDLITLLKHLSECRCNEHLEVVNILWMSYIADFPRTVLPFIQSCDKLQYFHLHSRYLDRTVETVLSALLENRPMSLKTMTFWFSAIKFDEDEGLLGYLLEEYHPLFQLMGVEIFLLVDPQRRQR